VARGGGDSVVLSGRIRSRGKDAPAEEELIACPT
jgi:hypothetical protein